MDVAFPQPKPFSKDDLDRVALWVTDPERGFGLRPEQVRVRHSDVMFDYELSAVLFNGLGMLKFNALGASFTANGARTSEDFALLKDSVRRFIGEISVLQVKTVAIGAHTHASMKSGQAREAFLSRFRAAPEILSPGVIGLLRPEPWLNDVRVAIEATAGSPDSVFVHWNTSLQITDDWETHLEALPEVFVGAVATFGLTLGVLGV